MQLNSWTPIGPGISLRHSRGGLLLPLFIGRHPDGIGGGHLWKLGKIWRLLCGLRSETQFYYAPRQLTCRALTIALLLPHPQLPGSAVMEDILCYSASNEYQSVSLRAYFLLSRAHTQRRQMSRARITAARTPITSPITREMDSDVVGELWVLKNAFTREEDNKNVMCHHLIAV